MRITALFLFTFLSYGLARAQDISGIVRDDRGKPLPNSSVALRTAKDSTLVKITLSDSTGQYRFSSIPAGNYFIVISHTAFQPAASAVFAVSDYGAGTIPPTALIPAPRELQEVRIGAVRPLVEVRPDRIVVNVANTINAIGENALDLLRKSPGITVDNNNLINLSGKNGVQVYVDGRPTYLSGANLAQYLETIQSSSIESIEIISNPPARYEAAGSAGIINFRLKKDKSLGTNLTANLGYNIGIYSKYNADISFNHRDRRINFFGDFTYHNGTTLGKSMYNRTIPDSLFLQQNVYLHTTVSETFHTGLDYFLNGKSTLGILISGSIAADSFRTNSNTRIVYTPADMTTRLLVADNRLNGPHDSYNFNLNYRYADSNGEELDLYADYALYRLRSNQLQPNNYFDSTGQHFLYSDNYNILSPTDIDIYSLKADYTLNWLKGQLGLGAKVSYVTSANDFLEYNLEGSVNVLDSLSSDNFNYRENINAAYVTYSRSLKRGLKIHAGLRVENTNGKGNSAGWQQTSADYSAYDSAYPRHYTDLFPNASLNWKSLTLSYSRRIDRPDYKDLNPFVFRIDDYVYSKGNTQLHPQYANSLNLVWSLNSLSATLSYSHISDLFTAVPDTTDRSKTVSTQVNLSGQDILGLNLSYFFQYKWYSLFVNANNFYAAYRANFGIGKVIDLNVLNTTIVSEHSFQLGRGWSANLSEYYSSPNIWDGTLRSHTWWSLGTGLQKNFFNGRATLKASVSDIFYTLRWTVTSNFAGQYGYSSGTNETRQLKLNFTWRFGNSQVKAARRHSTGAEDETGRVSSNSGGTP